MADNMKHIMISYQWDAQSRMIKLRDYLLRAGYDVWMDVDQMGNFLLHYLLYFYANSGAKSRSGLWPWVYTLSTNGYYQKGLFVFRSVL